MSHFRYKTVRRDGQMQHGVVELPFATPASAQEHFEGRGHTVIAIERISRLAGWAHAFITKLFRRRVRREELIELLRNMGVMLRSGVPILTTLDDVTAHSENPTLVRVAEDVRLAIEGGQQLADATDRHPDVFPGAVRHVIRIGEESGTLDRTLMDAAKHLERVHQIATNTKKSLIYPCFVVAAVLGATVFWIYYVIPAVSDLFRNLNVALPRVTLLVLSAVAFLEQNLRWMLFATLGLAVILFLGFRLIPGMSKRFHRLLLRMPIVGTLIRASNLAFIAEYFSLFTSAGVDVLKSLEILQRALTNQVYKDKLGAIRTGLLRGNSLTTEFGRHEVFPSFVVRMINVGESSGSLAEQLQYVAADYRRRLKDTVDRISETLKPLAILIVGAFFVFIVVALFLPVYHLVGQVSARGSF